MGWEKGRGFRREGTYVYLWLIHVDVWQRPKKYYKVITLQLKKKKEYIGYLVSPLPGKNPENARQMEVKRMRRSTDNHGLGCRESDVGCRGIKR